MPTLKISNNSVSNPQTLDLSNFLRLQPSEGTDPADPAFSERVWGRSLLKEGATLALEQLTEKELVFPVAFKGTSQSLVSSTLVIQANQILNTPGALCSWQDDGLSQPTYFDILSGQVDIEYDYFRGRQAWCNAKVRIFTQPFGHPPAPRPYAAASGVGPLLMITPYASGGALTAAASTQAGVAGYGVPVPGGVPSGGCFYWGAPSLAGDAPALLQLSYAYGGASAEGSLPPVAAVSLLPDRYYAPQITAAEFTLTNIGAPINAGGVVASQYVSVPASGPGGLPPSISFSPFLGASAGIAPTVAWAGSHRLFALARASTATGYLVPIAGPYVQGPSPGAAVASVPVSPTSWALYDLGVVTVRPSEAGLISNPKYGLPTIQVYPMGLNTPTSTAVEVNALYMLPDNSTWFINPSSSGLTNLMTSNIANALLLDDTLGDQFLFNPNFVGNVLYAPSPAGAAASSTRITQFSRGLVPRPDPRDGLPNIAILAIAVPGFGGGAPDLQARNSAQVNVLERTRYVLP